MADNGICPDWIVDNFDRYVSPFWEHVYLTLVVGRRSASRSPSRLALLAHRGAG